MAVALVTGASSGIGRAFATALAARHHDLVLVARTEARLKELAGELSGAHGVQAEVLVADLADDDDLARVETRVSRSEDPVDLLVNNAGFGSGGRFVELPLAGEDGQIRLNVLALMRLTHAALPGMVERRHGGVINVSSLGSFQPTPGFATYGATKAFVTSFSEALHEELRGTGVRVMAVCPGLTRTEFHERAKLGEVAAPGFAWMTAEDVARTALAAYDRGRALSVPGAGNLAVAWMTRLFPRAAVRRLSGLATSRLGLSG
ncbi:MAG: SDR family NAD(P)-dependent oxidoreductase [Acidimicrobiales bacterium]